MYADKRPGNLRGVKRKLATDEDDQQPKSKCKEPELTESIHESARRNNCPALDLHSNLNDHGESSNDRAKNDDLSNNHPNSTYSPYPYAGDQRTYGDLLSPSSLNSPSTGYLPEKTELIDELTNEFEINEELDQLNNNESSFNTFLNSSLTNCYVNSRPLTPLPQLDQEAGAQQEGTQQPAEQSSEQQLKSNATDSSPPEPQASSSSTDASGKENQQNLSPLNNFPALISNTKLFNSSSSLFNAAAIVDTYFSSKTKKSKLEKAKNMNHFRYSLFNKSLAKLNKFCNSSDPNIRNSVLVCNTLKRLERQLRKENIFLHLGPNGLAFVKLKNKRSNPEHLDYRNLVLDEASQIYVEKNEHSQSDEEDEEEEANEEFDRFGIDTDLDFNAAKQNETSSSSSSGSDSESDDLSDDLNNEIHSEELFESGQMNTDIISTNSSTITNSNPNSHPNSHHSHPHNVTLCNSELNSPNDLSYLAPANSSPASLVSNSLSGDSTTAWSEESNQYSWTNMFTNSLVLSEVEQQQQAASKENELSGEQSSYLFNTIEQSEVGQPTNDEIFSDIDSLITLYDLDLLSSVNNSTKEPATGESFSRTKPKSSINSQDSSSDEGSDTLNDSLTDPLNESLNDVLDVHPLSDTLNSTMFSVDSAIGLSSTSSLNNSLNSSLNSPLNSSLNSSICASSSSATSCSTSASVNSSSTSFPSNQANTQISPVIS